ncbi:MAG: hypothetical protein LWW83_13265 [Azonexaceae bacterium]|nr:hypothetical protein [Azonexaceae bacterium]
MPKKLLLLLALTVTSPLWAGEELFCCDAPGQGRLCGDSLPPQCRGLAHRIYDRAGNLVKTVGPQQTPEQKAAAAEEARKRKQMEDAQREQRRFDQALLDTYATPDDIDLTQQKAEDDINFSIRAAQAKLSDAQGRHRKLANEAEFYKRKPMPGDLDRDLRATAHEIQLQSELIEMKKKDLAQIRAKYDADRKRYYELTGRRSLRGQLPPAR